MNRAWFVSVALALAAGTAGAGWIADGEREADPGVWTAENDGDGSGLDADTVDGREVPGEVDGLDGRLDRAEMDVLNNYLYDAMRASVDGLPLLWGFADPFATTNYVESYEYFVYDEGNELFSTSLAGSGVAGLLIHMKLNDNAATSNLVDATGNGFNGYLVDCDGPTLANSSTYAGTGKINGDMDILTSEHVVGVIPFPLDTYVQSGSNFAFTFWAKLDAVSAYHEIVRVAMSGDSSSLIAITARSDNDMNVQVQIPDVGAPSWIGDNVFVGKAGVWQHFAFNWDWVLGQLNVYVNASRCPDRSGYATYTNLPVGGWPTFEQDPPPTGYESGIHIMGMAYGPPSYNQWMLGGEMDDFRFYNRALSQAEVEYIYNSGTGTEEGDGSPTPPPSTISEIVSSNWVYATSAEEGYLTVQLGLPAASDVTNVHAFVSAADPPAWDEVELAYQSTDAAGVEAWGGSTNFAEADTNLAVRLVVTNAVNGLQLHGWGYGRR